MLADGVRQLLTWVIERFFPAPRLKETLSYPSGAIPEKTVFSPREQLAHPVGPITKREAKQVAFPLHLSSWDPLITWSPSGSQGGNEPAAFESGSGKHAPLENGSPDVGSDLGLLF